MHSYKPSPSLLEARFSGLPYSFTPSHYIVMRYLENLMQAQRNV